MDSYRRAQPTINGAILGLASRRRHLKTTHFARSSLDDASYVEWQNGLDTLHWLAGHAQSRWLPQSKQARDAIARGLEAVTYDPDRSFLRVVSSTGALWRDLSAHLAVWDNFVSVVDQVGSDFDAPEPSFLDVLVRKLSSVWEFAGYDQHEPSKRRFEVVCALFAEAERCKDAGGVAWSEHVQRLPESIEVVLDRIFVAFRNVRNRRQALKGEHFATAVPTDPKYREWQDGFDTVYWLVLQLEPSWLKSTKRHQGKLARGINEIRCCKFVEFIWTLSCTGELWRNMSGYLGDWHGFLRLVDQIRQDFDAPVRSFLDLVVRKLSSEVWQLDPYGRHEPPERRFGVLTSTSSPTRSKIVSIRCS
ncbi:hypothetical protein JCM10212_005560 [Sporobolomyces blumeae]